MEGVRQMQCVKIVVGLEHVAHALGRPALDLGLQLLADELEIGQRVSRWPSFSWKP